MQGMTMPGGWTMSMAWMRMPGQTWPAAAASFLNMWTVMTLAMMLPVLVPMLRRCRRAAVVGSGYLLVWTLAGAAVFASGSALAALEMRRRRSRAPYPRGGSGCGGCRHGQFTRWKARQTRPLPANLPRVVPDFGAAWRHGLRIGLLCTRCCANLMAVLLVIGLMDVAP